MTEHHAETSPDNKWRWKTTEVSDGYTRWPGYFMHSTPQPRNPAMLCRWAIYKTGPQLAVIALNGRIFGYERSGMTLKACSRVERIVTLMGHDPETIPEDTVARRKKKS